MSYVQPYFSFYGDDVDVVDTAGDALIGFEDALASFEDGYEEALAIVNNWRASHQYPLNTFRQTLSSRARQIDAGADVVGRIKRRPAIEDKLNRMPSIKLSAMQDIGGCRAVLANVNKVYQLVDSYDHSNFNHELINRNDYIKLPRRSGYRSYHLIYEHFSRRWPIYDMLKVEIQIRSRLQHVWATAVETADIFITQGLKASRGDPDWSRFFVLMSSVLALKENCPRVPDAPKQESALIAEVKELAERLNVVPRLRHFGSSVKLLGDMNFKRSDYVVLQLDAESRAVTGWRFKLKDAEAASRWYYEQERTKPAGSDVVMLNARDAAAIRRAYPNYFLDASAFIQEVTQITAT
jgi:ppGpp synthetase/RelA/SpoT-type nucleotidyltranferase